MYLFIVRIITIWLQIQNILMNSFVQNLSGQEHMNILVRQNSRLNMVRSNLLSESSVC